jgi:hypothetical protein
MWTVAADIYNVITGHQIRASLFYWTYVHCYWRYITNTMCVILQTWCQIQRTSSSLRNVDCGPVHKHCNYSSTYSDFNIQMNVSALLFEICRQFDEPYTADLMPIQRTTSSLRNVDCGPGHIQCIYSSAYSGFNIQLNVSPPLFETCRQFNAPYTANILPNTAHIL